jgi:hypothetical protein
MAAVAAVRETQTPAAQSHADVVHTCAKFTLVLAAGPCGLDAVGNSSRIDVYASPHRVDGYPQHRAGWRHEAAAFTGAHHAGGATGICLITLGRNRKCFSKGDAPTIMMAISRGVNFGKIALCGPCASMVTGIQQAHGEEHDRVSKMQHFVAPPAGQGLACARMEGLGLKIIVERKHSHGGRGKAWLARAACLGEAGRVVSSHKAQGKGPPPTSIPFLIQEKERRRAGHKHKHANQNRRTHGTRT